jgi:hypothetical protein
LSEIFSVIVEKFCYLIVSLPSFFFEKKSKNFFFLLSGLGADLEDKAPIASFFTSVMKL